LKSLNNLSVPIGFT